MNVKNLVMTSTVNMSREDWLNFRNPVWHVAKLLKEHKVETYADAAVFFESEVWGNFVFPCVGGSEASAVMGLNPYKAIIELYYEKVGVKPVPDFDNAAMFWGRELEEQIADKWQYFDGEVEGMIENFKAGTIIRKCQRVNAYIQNKACAWLFVSLDRKINRTKNGKYQDASAGEGALECKTISGFAANVWENGLPPAYVVQVQQQLHVCEFAFGEMAILKDGRNYEVLPFDYNEGICASLLQKTFAFYELVREGVKHFFLATMAVDEATKQHHMAEIDRLSPEPDGSVSYKDYLAERYTDEGYSKPGGILELKLAQEYVELGKVIKGKETEQLERRNKLCAFLGDASTLDFGNDGKVTWKADKKGTRSFRVNIKE